MTQNNNNNKVINGVLEYRQFIILDDGSEVRVRYNQNKDLYAGSDVQLYQYQASEGSGDTRKEVTRFAVEYTQALRATRTSTKDSIQAMLAGGMTAKEIVTKLTQL